MGNGDRRPVGAEGGVERLPKELGFWKRCLIGILAFFLRLYYRTLRFRWGEDVQKLMDHPLPPCVVVFWHNRLFPSPEFFRRHFSHRRLAAVVSASSDGAWASEFIRRLNMVPIRGSRNKRGAQAVREMLAAVEAGYDVALTPDGSKGPLYEMKEGAVAVAMKTGAPVLLLSFNFGGTWRLRSWDRFYVPKPFSCIEARVDSVGHCQTLGESTKETIAPLLKARLDAITEDRESKG